MNFNCFPVNGISGICNKFRKCNEQKLLVHTGNSGNFHILGISMLRTFEEFRKHRTDNNVQRDANIH